MSTQTSDPSRAIASRDLVAVRVFEGIFAVSSLGSGDLGGLIFSVIPNTPSVQLYDFVVETRVDTDDALHQWPIGASLTAAQSELTLQVWGDEGSASIGSEYTDDLSGERTFYVAIHNRDVSSHTYYLRFAAYALQGDYEGS